MCNESTTVPTVAPVVINLMDVLWGGCQKGRGQEGVGQGVGQEGGRGQRQEEK